MNEDSIVMTSRGYAIEALDFFPDLKAGLGNVKDYLASPKSKKFMGKQDILSVTALGRALENTKYQGDRSGIYMSVGYIPFEKDILESIAQLSSDGTLFSMAKFLKDTISVLNPLMTFRCLPNMPVYHCSVNFQITANYYVTHPSIGEFYQCLKRAIADLKSHRVDKAMVGACADMSNFLVSQRMEMEGHEIHILRDSAAFIILERSESVTNSSGNDQYVLSNIGLSYDPDENTDRESFNGLESPYYPGSPSLALFLNCDKPVMKHHGRTRTGYIFESTWEKL